MTESSSEDQVDTKLFVSLMLRLYGAEASRRYERAEELIAQGLAEYAAADAIMDRCADLVAENLDPEGEMEWPPEEDNIDW